MHLTYNRTEERRRSGHGGRRGRGRSTPWVEAVVIYGAAAERVLVDEAAAAEATGGRCGSVTLGGAGGVEHGRCSARGAIQPRLAGG